MAEAQQQRPSRMEIRFSGSGGQGILLAAAIVADAATTLGKRVVQTQSYGPAARGGASKAEVIVANDAIDYPEVATPDVSLCLSQAAYDKYAHETRADGLVVFDSGLVDPGDQPHDFQLCGLPFTQASAEHLKRKVVANIVALGALVAVGGVLPPDEVEEAVTRRVPERFRELNVAAYRLGLEMAEGAGASDRRLELGSLQPSGRES